MAPKKELTHRDEIHGDVYYDPLAVALLDTATLQRLGRVYQLGYGHLVYRGGNHTRLSHCMGAYATAGRLVDALEQNYARQNLPPRGAIKPGEFLPRGPMGSGESDQGVLDLSAGDGSAAPEGLRWIVLRHLVRWAGLVHDVGHVPLGHTLEDEFKGIYNKHDSFASSRLRSLWVTDASGAAAEIRAVFRRTDLYPDAFRKLGIVDGDDVWGTVLLICTWKEKVNASARTRFEDLLRAHIEDREKEENDPGLAPILLELCERLNGTLFAPYMADIVANTISADYLDYLRRDPHNLGLDVLKDDRVVSRFWVGRDHLQQGRMALSLVDRRGKPRLDTCTGVVELVRQRYRFAEIVYYHKTKVAASAMLAKVFDLVGAPADAPGVREVPVLGQVDALAAQLATFADVTRGERAKRLRDLRALYMPSAISDVEIGDDSLHLLIRTSAWEKLETAAADGDHAGLARALHALVLLDGITHRRLHKVAFAMGPAEFRTITDKGENDGERALGELIEALRGDATARAEAEATMVAASDGWPDQSLLLYVPPRKSQAKGIETGALSRDGVVTTLEEHPAVSGDVKSLNERYKALWRLMVLVHPDHAEDAIGLSCAIDALIETQLPSVNLDDHTVIAAISECSWFHYFPRRERAAARTFTELRDGRSDEAPWSLLDLFADHQTARGSDREVGMGAALLERLGGGAAAVQRLGDYSKPGALETAVDERKGEVLAAASVEGGADVDAGTQSVIAALNKIADELSG